jgi:hypothetical protein
MNSLGILAISLDQVGNPLNQTDVGEQSHPCEEIDPWVFPRLEFICGEFVAPMRQRSIVPSDRRSMSTSKPPDCELRLSTNLKTIVLLNNGQSTDATVFPKVLRKIEVNS